MPQIELAGKIYEVDEDGFLQELDKWSEEFANAYAHAEEIEGDLTEEHWKVINYLRNYCFFIPYYSGEYLFFVAEFFNQVFSKFIFYCRYFIAGTLKLAKCFRKIVVLLH